MHPNILYNTIGEKSLASWKMSFSFFSHLFFHLSSRLFCLLSNEHARAEGLVNYALGSSGQAVRAAAQATHSMTCGVPDRESNEIKYPREATEVIERWQQQLQDGQPVSQAPSEHGEVILIGRQW